MMMTMLAAVRMIMMTLVEQKMTVKMCCPVILMTMAITLVKVCCAGYIDDNDLF